MKYIGSIFAYISGFAIILGLGYLFFYLYKIGVGVPVIIVIAFYSLFSLFNLIIFIQKRHTAAKLSWIIIMTIFPIFGHCIYIIFGQRYRQRKSLSQYHQKETFRHEDKTYNSDIVILNKQSHISQRGVYPADINLIDNGGDGYKLLFQEMLQAKHFIHIHFYIIKPGEIYEHFKKILIQKAKEGVEIRLIVDDFGRWAIPWYEIKELKNKGIQVKIFGKVNFPFIGSENGYRTHRKMVVIDGNQVHTGGINVADEYANLNKKYGLWIDFQTIIKGAGVKSYSLLFIDDWFIVSGENLNIQKYGPTQEGGSSNCILVEDSPEIEDNIIHNSLISWILNAKKEIKITTPYFIPTREIFIALQTSALAGVDITIYIPGKPDKKMVLIASENFAQQLHTYGVKFKTTKNILIHSKIGYFDGEFAYLGTNNIDMRSFYSQFEILNLVSGPIVTDIKNLFDYYDTLSEPLILYKKPTILDRINRVWVGIISPLM